jgi:hypothetical protein
MTSWQETALANALKMLELGAPKNMISRATADVAEAGLSVAPSDVTALLSSAGVNNAFLNQLGVLVHKWDAAGGGEAWTSGSEPSTAERRKLICQLLGIDAEGQALLLDRRPIFHDETIIITAPWHRWYTDQRASARAFYWPHYRDYLLSVKRWSPDNVAALDLAATDILERVADPARAEAYQSKGLVVGYVQSGKTANFTGVIAKAIDAGYRLVIVMTGTIELLRVQTQRRIDMELVGRQNILGDLTESEAAAQGVDYFDDEDWRNGRFLDFGKDRAPTEIHRLTQHKADYQQLQNHFRTLKIERANPTLPLYHEDNLFSAAARLAIVKKNATVLKKLVHDVRTNKNAFAEIPVLIIDDESDEASPNVIDPAKVQAAKAEGREVTERNAINARIADLLNLMPRAQYIGYTATPFANVFADPSDPLGIFPKDFVIGLQRPPGYMGVEDFYDLDSQPEAVLTPATSNERAFVRDLSASDSDIPAQDEELARATDMFVLTGAVKLFREARDSTLSFRHHTMLVHEAVRVAAHKELAERLRNLWSAAQFAGPAGRSRLKALYESDVVAVSRARVEPGVPLAPAFDELEAFIPRSIQRITEHQGNPIIVVNSDKEIEQQNLDFDRQSIWRILVGGAKLSRGFTVEGLTVTYFRRATDIGATLTQMGRWFGFRPGYRDLVRLFIARRASFGKREIDLYEAFNAIALDEAAFRSQLRQYAVWDGDKPRVVPAEIPPLVSQHLPWLRPVSKNKMFNAVVEEQADQPLRPTGYANSVAGLRANLESWRPLLAEVQTRVDLQQPDGASYAANIGTVAADLLIEVAEAMEYIPYYRDRVVKPRLTFYRRLIAAGSLVDFLLVMPQPVGTESVDVDGVGVRSTVSRDRRPGRGGLFGEITDPKHRPAVERFVSGPIPDELQSYHAVTRGAVLIYLVRESTPDYGNGQPVPGVVAVAFASYVPALALGPYSSVIRFSVRSPAEPGVPTIDVRDGQVAQP